MNKNTKKHEQSPLWRSGPRCFLRASAGTRKKQFCTIQQPFTFQSQCFFLISVSVRSIVCQKRMSFRFSCAKLHIVHHYANRWLTGPRLASSTLQTVARNQVAPNPTPGRLWSCADMLQPRYVSVKNQHDSSTNSNRDRWFIDCSNRGLLVSRLSNRGLTVCELSNRSS